MVGLGGRFHQQIDPEEADDETRLGWFFLVKNSQLASRFSMGSSEQPERLVAIQEILPLQSPLGPVPADSIGRIDE